MLLKEKPRQEHVDPQQSEARERHQVVGCGREVAFGLQRLELIVKALENIDVVLLVEIRRSNLAELELQHELPDHLFLVRGPVGAAQRHGAAGDRLAIGFPRVHVLHVHAVDVPE